MRHLSLFSGIGAFDLAFEWAGFGAPVAQVERDKHCLDVLNARWPDVEKIDDIHNVRGGRDRFKHVNVITGGFPCQDLSVAGDGAGLSGERSGLFFEMLRVVEESEPIAVVWENVPGLARQHNGDAMRTVVESLAGIGYFGAWRCLDSKHFGCPQARRRIFGAFVREDCGGWAAGAAILLEPEDPGWNSQAAVREGNNPAEPTEDNTGTIGGMIPTPCMYDGSTIAPCLDRSMLMKRQMMPEKSRCPVIIQSETGFVPRLKYAVECEPCPDCGEPYCEDCMEHYYDCNCLGPHNLEDLDYEVSARLLTPLEVERAFGFPDNWTDCGISDTQRYGMLGNSIVVPVAYWIALRTKAILGAM